MRYLSLVVATLLLFPSPSPALELKFRTGEVHGLFDFVKSVQGASHRAKRLKEIYDQSSFAKAKESEDALKQMASLDQNLLQWENFFETQSILARDLEDFESRTRGILPITDQQRLLATLTYFLPVYRALVRKGTAKDLRREAVRMERAGKKPPYRKLINQIPNFYRSPVPAGTAFTIGLVAIPGPKASSFATSLGAVESVGVVIGDKDLPGTMGVIAHELCHSFSTVGAWSETFRTLNNPHAAMAFRNLEESLATAIGNGHAYRTLKGEDDRASWYNNPVIEAYARALYPLTNDYLRKKRSLDEEFMTKAAEVFGEHVAALTDTYDAYLDTVVIGAAAPDRFRINDLFRRSFPMKSIYSEPFTSEAWAHPSGETWMASAVLVVREEDRQEFAALAKKVPALSPLESSLFDGKSSFWEGLIAGRAYFVFKVGPEADLEDVVERVAARKKPELGAGLKRVF